MRCDDPALAARWAALRDLPDGSLGQGGRAVLRRARLRRSRDGRRARRRCSRSTTGCTCSPTTARPSKPRSRCSAFIARAQRRPARVLVARDGHQPVRDRIPRDAARACSSTTAATSRTKAWPSGSPTRCAGARWSERTAGGPDLLARRLVRATPTGRSKTCARSSASSRSPSARSQRVRRPVVAGRHLAVPVRVGRRPRPRRPAASTTRSELSAELRASRPVSSPK